MYAVIFRATIKELDSSYFQMAQSLRDLAIEKFGCLEFFSNTENGQEIAISYWPTLDAIQNWKQQSEHLIAQEQGKTSWYQDYSVDIVEVVRHYRSTNMINHSEEYKG
jgi:heme-degrading monooxygenase HmoA